MKPFIPSLEILLVATTSFSARQFCENNDQEKKENADPKDHLVSACWNGLLNEILPEIMRPISTSHRLFLWDIESGDTCLLLSFGEYHSANKSDYSLSTRYFLQEHSMN